MGRRIKGLPRIPRFWIAVAFAWIASACAVPPVPADYRDAYPLKVKTATFAMAVKISPFDGTLAREDETRLQGFVREYHRRSRGSLVVATPPGDEGLADRALFQSLRARLVDEGVRPNDIVLESGRSALGEDSAVILSFRGLEVEVPECGDWSGDAGFNPTNLPHTNYGCAYQRNIGLIVSNPADLVKSGPVGPMDARRGDVILEHYRVGEPTATTVPSGEEATVGGE